MNIYDILDEIEQAYPKDIFPDTRPEERARIFEKYPGFIDRTSAMMGWHLAEVIRRRLAEAEGAKLRKTARQLLEYHDRFGGREFNQHFGTKDIPGEQLVEFLRKFLAEGDASNPSDVGNLATL